MVYWAGWSAIVVAVVLTLLHTVDLLVGPPPKITLQSLRTKPLPALSEDGTKVYLKGDFDFDLNSDLHTLLKQNAKKLYCRHRRHHQHHRDNLHGHLWLDHYWLCEVL